MRNLLDRFGIGVVQLERPVSRSVLELVSISIDYLSISIIVYRSPSISIDIYRYLSLSIDIYHYLSISIILYHDLS
mgnify:CR=1 FL=1